jgi:hypothetical protein
MARFKRPTPGGADGRRFEEALYEAVVAELAEGVRRPGLWAKAFADTGGDDTRAIALYLKLRAQAILDESAEAARMNAEVAAARQAEATRRCRYCKRPGAQTELVRSENKWRCLDTDACLDVQASS